ncbi:MAG: PEP-CTERM sorting domain-containing protein [Pirellulaceae bacterium]
MSCRRNPSRLFLLTVLLVVFSSGRLASADIVAVFFTGFNPGLPPTGMDELDARLANGFAANHPALTYSSQVFAYNERTEAFNFIDGFNDIDALFLAGHSWGGNALIRLAQELLLPAGIEVDMSFQIDSVDLFDSGLGDDVLPTNVKTGFNFFQIAGQFDLQGEMFVDGAININVEEFFNDQPITHTTIDNYEPLHDLIYVYAESAVPEPGVTVVIGLGIMWVMMRRERAHRG